MRYQPRPLLRNLSHAIESRLLFTPVQLLYSGHPSYRIGNPFISTVYRPGYFTLRGRSQSACSKWVNTSVTLGTGYVNFMMSYQV